jgi:hypothetical protein
MLAVMQSRYLEILGKTTKYLILSNQSAGYDANANMSEVTVAKYACSQHGIYSQNK